MDIKEIALKVADSLRNKVDGVSHMQSNQGLVRFAEALVAELAKQNEPVLYAEFAEDGGWLGVASEYQDYLEEPHELYTSNQVAAAILKATKPLEEEVERLQEEGNLPVRYYQPNGKGVVYAVYGSSSIDFVEELRAQLAAAQEEGATVTSERDNLWFKLETAKAELADLRDQFAKAEQRVAEACALTYLEDYDLTDIAERVRAGEWRKFVKEM